jgi:hydrogenase/urease accessory protein HupE
VTGAARRAAIAAAVGLCALAAARRADAHAVGMSNGNYRLVGRTFSTAIGMSERELLMLLPELDQDRDGQLDADELAAGSASVVRGVVDGIRVEADGAPCPGALDRARVIEGEGGVLIEAHWACPTDPARLSVAWPVLTSGGLSPSHRHLAYITAGGSPVNVVLDRAHASWSSGGAAGTVFWSMLKLGVEHILTGYDHLVFLLGLIIVGGSLRSLVGVVSAFTLAHSITLALAALGVLAPSPRFVEPAIALSIAYVGIENLFVKDASRRWRITFPFGLIHGFGFAGALREIALPRAQIPVALVSFNLGVELGQLAVLALALPLVLAARRAPRFGERGVRAVSSTIALAGVVLFVVRVVSTG